MGDDPTSQSNIEGLVAQYSSSAVIRNVRLLAASTQGEVFMVELAGEARPVVAKLFRSHRPDVFAAINDEFVSLGLMAGVFRDAEIDGWSVSVPEPLFRSEEPAGLLMTAVPGVPLNGLLTSLTPAVRHDLASRVCEALVMYWSRTGRLVADVNLSNILADVEERRLAIVDPGLPEADFLCPGVPDEFAPSSRDLGFLLFHVLANNVKVGLVARRTAQVRAMFAADVVHNYAERYLTSTQVPAFFAEVEACANRHIGRIPVGGPKEPWRQFIRKRVGQQLAATIAELSR